MGGGFFPAPRVARSYLRETLKKDLLSGDIVMLSFFPVCVNTNVYKVYCRYWFLAYLSFSFLLCIPLGEMLENDVPRNLLHNAYKKSSFCVIKHDNRGVC